MPYFGLIADEDLRDLQFHAVKFVGGAGNDWRVGKIDTANDREKYAGILLNSPNVGEAATVSRPEDLASKVKFGAAVAAGDRLMADEADDGKLIPVTGTEEYVAVSPVNGVDNEVATVFLNAPTKN